MNKLILLFSTFLLASNLIYADQNIKYPRGMKDLRLGVPLGGTSNKEVKIEDLDDLIEGLPEPDGIRKWLSEAGYHKYDNFYNTFIKIIIKTWESAINTILTKCELDRGLKTIFENNINNPEKANKLIFTKDLKTSEGWPAHGDSTYKNRMKIALNENFESVDGQKLNGGYLKQIIQYVAKKLAENSNNPNIDDYESALKEYISTLGHEMLHEFGELEKPDEDDLIGIGVRSKF